MAVLTHLETDTGTNVDISGATAVGSYTANGDKLIMVDVSIDAVAGNGDYVMYVTRQIGGSGSAYRILPQTTMAAASGLTAISAQSGWITVRNKDVLTCYVDGLAGDTSTPDWTTRWFELAGVTAAGIADAVLDEATSGHTTAGTFGKAVSDILADTGTDGVVVGSIVADAITAAALKADAVTKIQNGLATPTNITAASGVTLGATQGAITWAQQKIVANASLEGALDLRNLNANGVGLRNWGTKYGMLNLATGASSFGQVNESQGASGVGLQNNATGTTSKGLVNSGTAQDVDGYDPALATAAALDTVDNFLDTEIAAILADTNELQTDLANGGRLDLLIDAIKAKTDNLPADPADDSDIDAQLAAIKAETALILADTGTDGVVVASLANDSITAAALKADAVTEIQNGLALEATLTAIKGTGWVSGDSLRQIKSYSDAIYTDLVNGGRIDLLIDSIVTHLLDIKGDDGWTGQSLESISTKLYHIMGAGFTDESLVKVVNDIAAISAGSGATAQEVWEYVSRTLTDPDSYKADVSALATTTHVQEVEDKVDIVDGIVDAVKVKTDLIPTSPAQAGEYAAALDTIDNEIAVIDGIVDDILEDTGTTLDTLIKDIPTNAELATALGTADDAVLAALATTDGKVDSILEDTGTTLDTLIKDIPTNTELATALGTADDAVLAAVAAAKVVIDDIHNTDLPAIKAETALIVEDTGMTLPATLGPINEYDANFTQLVDLLKTIMGGEAWTDETLVKIASDIAALPAASAQQVWIYPTRTLVQPGISLETPAAGSELILYKDATNVIFLSGLGDLTNRTQAWFTIKANLDMPDDDAILQVTETGNLQHINQISGGDLGIDKPDVTMAVTNDGQATITISAEAGQALPVMQVTPVEWDFKVAFSDGTVIPIQVGTAYIRQTATRAIS